MIHLYRVIKTSNNHNLFKMKMIMHKVRIIMIIKAINAIAYPAVFKEEALIVKNKRLSKNKFKKK
jgi:hypothetical protein